MRQARLRGFVAMGGLLVMASSWAQAAEERNFGDDVAYLSKHVATKVLADPQQPQGPKVAVVGAYQARVMTSSAQGDAGTSYGWLNYAQIEQGATAKHINVFGGEERFWLGPEGGQFALYFAPGAKFVFDDWQTPAVIDSEPFEAGKAGDTWAEFHRTATLENFSGTKLAMRIDRRVELVSAADAQAELGVAPGGVSWVGYRTINQLTNTGTEAWAAETGLPSIWLLGMYKHGPRTTVVIPVRGGDDAALGTKVNDDYFGKVPPERLRVVGNTIYFSGDGQQRGKIGIPPRRSLGIAGSYDAARGVLTVVRYELPTPPTDRYVNSQWALQDNPLGGDAINAYNDGPPGPGLVPLGPFYELETSSPALALAPGATSQHRQTTYHFEGTRQQLDPLAKQLLGVDLATIEAALAAAAK